MGDFLKSNYEFSGCDSLDVCSDCLAVSLVSHLEHSVSHKVQVGLPTIFSSENSLSIARWALRSRRAWPQCC